MAHIEKILSCSEASPNFSSALSDIYFSKNTQLLSVLLEHRAEGIIQAFNDHQNHPDYIKFDWIEEAINSEATKSTRSFTYTPSDNLSDTLSEQEQKMLLGGVDYDAESGE